MTNYNDGKIHGWNGGECPVHPETRVAAWLKGGSFMADAVTSNLEWRHGFHELAPEYDIIAFQVVKEYREPTTIWVNEYPGGYPVAHGSEAEAREYATSKAIRIAVKYQEVIE